MSTAQDAAELIKARLRENQAERKALEKALDALGGGPPAPRRTNARKPQVRRNRAPRGQRREQLLKHLEKNPGAKPTDIAGALKTSPANVHNLLRKAREDKLVRKDRGGGYRVSKAAQKAASSK